MKGFGMPKFRYTAKRGPRDIVEGVVEAENRSGVLAHLAQLGYVPVRVTEETLPPAAVASPSVRQARHSIR